jgi:formiminotetrahydrofolate cyclodeaminase
MPVSAEQTVRDFAERLASAAPAPGGGSAAAMAGGLAAALVAMVARGTLGKKRFADRAEQMARIADEASGYQAELLRLVDEDAEAYEAVVMARRLPRGTPEEAERRAREAQLAVGRAIDTPFRLSQRAVRLLELAREVIREGNPASAPDGGVAAFLASAALAGGMLTIRANLAQVTDEEAGLGIAKQAQALQAAGGALLEEIEAALDQAMAPAPS